MLGAKLCPQTGRNCLGARPPSGGALWKEQGQPQCFWGESVAILVPDARPDDQHRQHVGYRMVINWGQILLGAPGSLSTGIAYHASAVAA